LSETDVAQIRSIVILDRTDTPPGMERNFIRAGAQALADGAHAADHQHYHGAQGGSTN
jgi:hypothetical protein